MSICSFFATTVLIVAVAERSSSEGGQRRSREAEKTNINVSNVCGVICRRGSRASGARDSTTEADIAASLVNVTASSGSSTASLNATTNGSSAALLSATVKDSSETSFGNAAAEGDATATGEGSSTFNADVPPPWRGVPKERPNILLVLADDMNKNSVGIYGNTNVKTPHMDRLASEGMRFYAAYTSTAMCAPTRAQIYTGRYPFSSGVVVNHAPIKTGVRTMPSILSQLGYRVGIQGKGHVNPTSAFPFQSAQSGWADWILSPKNGKEAPWCLVYASSEPHKPWYSGDQSQFDPESFTLPPFMYSTTVFRESLVAYYAEITVLDGQLGETMELLEQNNLEDNTVVIFTSEQGANIPGCKFNLWEPGINVAFIIRWPGVIQPNSISNAMIHYIDIVPTFIELAGSSSQHFKGLDGKSFVKVLTGETSMHNTVAYGVQTDKVDCSGYNIRSIREGSYKYIWNLDYKKGFGNPGSYSDWWGFRNANKTGSAARLVRRQYCRTPEELYNLDEDPDELFNLARNRNATHAEIITRMKQALQQWMSTQGDTCKKVSKPRTVCYNKKVANSEWGEY